MQGPFWRVLCKAPWSLSSVDLESTCCCGLGQTQCGPYTVSTAHTHQPYLLAVYLPPHNTTEQVSLNKWPSLPPCVRVEIRCQKDLQTEAKINKEEGTALEVTDAKIKTLSLTLTKDWRGPINLENKCRLEQEQSETQLTSHCPQQLQRNS